MDWKELNKYETIPGRALSKGVTWEVNEIVNGNGKENSPASYGLKNAICRVIAASMGYRTMLQMREGDMQVAKERAELLLGWMKTA